MPKKIESLVEKYFAKKGLPWRPALTFDDVSLITKFSDIRRRSDITDFQTKLAKNFFLNIPIVSANMQDVTDSRLAIALARLGGLGFIHQFSSLEERLKEVQKVKRADNALVDDPLTIGSNATFGNAKTKMAEYGISSILITDKAGRLVGILTSRDYRFTDPKDDNLPVTKIMKPMPLITAKPNISMAEAVAILEKHKIEKLPLVDKSGKIRGLITAKDIAKKKEYPNALRDKKGRLAAGVTLRLTGDYLQEAEKFLSAGADALLLDTARAGATIAAEAVKKLRKKSPGAVLAVGNIDNPEHVEILASAGADSVKVGIGPGARCKTRMVAGVGVPQIHAIASCAAMAEKLGISVIGDGGIRGSGDLAKALAAGADAVMIGSLFAGTDESPGLLIRKGNQLWKQYRGSASLEHQLERIQKGSLDEIRNPEGESEPVAYAGSLNYVISGLLDGLRSAMSYVGAHDLNKLREKSEFIWVSRDGYEEGKPQI